MDSIIYNPIFSIMKGLAIVGVVWGHCTSFEFVENFLNQWHLAVFFFVAGYFTKGFSDDANLKDLFLAIWKKTKRLYFPFLQSCIIFLCLHNLFYSMHFYEYTLSKEELVKGIINICIRLTTNEQLVGAMWFCVALLIVSIIALISLYYSKNYCLFCLLPFIVGSLCLYTLKIKSPYSIWQCMIVSAVFFQGNIFRKYGNNSIFCSLTRTKLFSFFVVSIVLLLVLTYTGIYGRLQVDWVKRENPIMILLISGIGNVMIYTLAVLLSRVTIGRIFECVGKCSFSIMLFHFLSFKLVSFVFCKIHNISYEHLMDFPTPHHNWLWSILFVLVGVSIPVILSQIREKMCKKY